MSAAAGPAAASALNRSGPVAAGPPAGAAWLAAARPLPAPVLPVAGASVLASGMRRSLWSLHGNAELSIASTTKLMTSLVVLQHVRELSTVFAQMNWTPAPEDSQIGLIPGERMTVHDLMLAMLLPSADDAAMDLAYNVGGGSIARFVGWMNADARKLGLRRTHYSTPVGFDTPGNYSTPNDLVRLGDYMMRHHPVFRHIVGLSTATLTSGRYVRHIVNTNDLLARYPWIHGIKTGTTTLAGHVLVADARRHGITLVASVLGAGSDTIRDSSMMALLNWAFEQFRRVRLVRAGEVFARPSSPSGLTPVSIVAARGYRTVLGRGTRVRLLVGRLRSLAGPLPEGTVVGQLRVVIHGRRTVRIPLVLARGLPAAAIPRGPGHAATPPIALVLPMSLALLLGGGVAVTARVRRWRTPRALGLNTVDGR